MTNPSPPDDKRPGALLVLFLIFWLPVLPVFADQLEIVVRGVDEPLRGNVLARTQSFQVIGNTRLSKSRLEEERADAERRAGLALRPFGYYHPDINSELRPTGENSWEIVLRIDKGPPVVITSHRVEISGPGKSDHILTDWQSNWPLTDGDILDQSTWEDQKTNALNLAESHGYLGASFSTQVINLDLERNTADLVLVLETGEQAVMGSVVYNQDIVDARVLENIPRFSEGQPYDSWLLEQFRLDLWRTGYFENIEVIEERRLEESPPRVNLAVNMEARKRNTYQGGVGYGTDTDLRLQGSWSRHLLSSRGDSLEVGVGWQERRNEISFRTIYRQPRLVAARQFWTAELMFKTENQKFTVSPNEDPRQKITIARGNVDDYSIKPGWLRIRSVKNGFQQIFEHWYVQYVNERVRFESAENLPPDAFSVPEIDDSSETLRRPTESLAVGVSWNWPVVRGNGFETVGYTHNANVFTSNTAWGSDIDFTQAYLSSRWNRIFSDRWKILLRGEVGYTNARVIDRTVISDGNTINLSVTELPYVYRFKAGGSHSVRGYGFEDLSNNSIGSNNIVTGSAELEFRFMKNWSAAAFFDIGNAFNDWDQLELKKGAGVGIRWYSIAGAFRLDFAQALDEPGKPWRLHFTIGSPLL